MEGRPPPCTPPSQLIQRLMPISFTWAALMEEPQVRIIVCVFIWKVEFQGIWECPLQAIQDSSSFFFI